MLYIKSMIKQRNTRYATAVKAYLLKAGHATNTQILRHLQIDYPELSATTVHRITARMVDRGELNPAPPARDSAVRFDLNISAHDHFQCLNCDRLRDFHMPQEMFDSVQDMMGDCKLNGRLTVQGSCDMCLRHTEEV